MFKVKAIVAAAGMLALPAMSQAAGPTLTDIFTNSGITEAGYVDAGFNYNNRQFNAGTFGYGGANNDSFTLNQVGLSLSMTPAAGFGGVVDILAGHDAGGVPSDGGGDVVLKQAYVQYGSGALTVIGGRFVTLAGSEVINSSQNSNATRSLLFAYQPLTHTGVRASYKISDAVTLVGGVNNSIFGFTNDNNEQKTGELSIALAPAEGLTLALTAYKGNETGTGVIPPAAPLLIDFVTGFQVTKTVSLGLNFDHVEADTATNTKVDGAALYANVQVSDPFRAGVRLEFVDTKDDVAPKRKQKEVTLTGDYAAAKNFDLLTDVRYDKDDALIFSGKESMVSVTVRGIYKF